MAESLEDNKNIFEQIEKKYAPEVKNIFEAVKTAYDLPWTTVEDADYKKVEKAFDSKNPYVREIANVILGATDKDKNSTLNTYISDKLADLTTWITTNESRKGTPATKSMIHSFGPNLVKEAVTNTVRNTLSNDKTMAWLAEKIGGSEGKKVSQYFKDQRQLPAYAKLAIRQYVPEGLEKYKDPKTGETKTRRTYEPITDKNVKEWFSNKDKETLKDILRERDLEKPIADFGLKKLGDINLGAFIHSRDDKKNQTQADFNARQRLDHALGKVEYGHYDNMGIWREGVPNLEGNYTVRDRYDWGRDQASGLGKVLSLIKAGFTKPSYIDRDLLETPLQMTGALTKRQEGRDIEFTVPTYKNDPMALMNVMSSRLGPYTGSDNKTVTPLGQGDLPGFGWQEDAFYTDDTDDAPTETEDPGYYDEDIDLRGGGQISQGLDNLYMNKRNEPKEKLYHMMGFQDRQYGGGLDDAYMTLSERRRRSSAFADPDATSAFANGGLPMVYRREGGGEFDEYEDESISLTTEELTPTAETYTQDQLDQLSQAFAPSPQLSDLADPDLGYTAPEIAAIRGEQRAAAEQDEADRRSGFLEGTTRFVTDQRTSIPTKEEYQRSLEKYGYEPWQTAYLNDLISKGYDINQAQSLVASAMATPGGMQGMKDAYEGGYSYGGPAGTLQDLLERGTMQSLGIEDILKKDKKRRAEDKEEDKMRAQAQGEVSESFLERIGLGGIADKLIEILSIQGEMSPKTVTAIKEILPEGAKFTPSGFEGTAMDLTIPLIGKGLASMTDTGKTVGTIEIGDLTFNLNMTKDGGRLSLDTSSINTFDEGNEDIRPIRRKKDTEKTTEDKKETTKKTSTSPSLRKKHIEDIKSYMSYTGKSVSESKKDLNITDVSITEEDFT